MVQRKQTWEGINAKPQESIQSWYKVSSPESQVADTDSFKTLSCWSNIMATCFKHTENI